MRIEQLKFFLDVSKTHSLNESAKNMYITQPALSRAIQALETELGIVLFERTKKGIYPNAIGQSFVAHAQGVVDAYQEALAFINSCLTFSQPIHLFALPIISNTCVPTMLDLLALNFPQLQIQYRDILPDEICDALQNTPNALVLFIDNEYNDFKGGDCPELIFHHIDEDIVGLFLSKNSPYTNQKAIAYEEDILQIFLRDYNITPRISSGCFSQNLNIDQWFILKKNGVLSLPYKLGKQLFADIPDIVSRPTEPLIGISYQIITHRRLLQDEFTIVFKFIANIFKELLNNTLHE